MPSGGGRRVAASTRARTRAVNFQGRRPRWRLVRPSTPCSRNRRRHLAMVGRNTSSFVSTARAETPSARSTTILGQPDVEVDPVHPHVDVVARRQVPLPERLVLLGPSSPSAARYSSRSAPPPRRRAAPAGLPESRPSTAPADTAAAAPRPPSANAACTAADPPREPLPLAVVVLAHVRAAVGEFVERYNRRWRRHAIARSCQLLSSTVSTPF